MKLHTVWQAVEEWQYKILRQLVSLVNFLDINVYGFALIFIELLRKRSQKQQQKLQFKYIFW